MTNSYAWFENVRTAEQWDARASQRFEQIADTGAQVVLAGVDTVSQTAFGKWIVDSFDGCFGRSERVTSTPAEKFVALLPNSKATNKNELRNDSPEVESDEDQAFCAVGCVGCTSTLKAFESRPFDFIPYDFKSESLTQHIGYSCRAGLDSLGALCVDQTTMARAGVSFLFASVFGIGSGSCTFSDRCALLLLKRSMVKFGIRGYSAVQTRSLSQKDIELRFSSLFEEVQEYLRANSPELAMAVGCGVATAIIRDFADEVHVSLGVLGGMSCVRIIVATLKDPDTCVFQWTEVTPNHSLADTSERHRFSVASGTPPDAYAAAESTPTRALGLFDQSKFGLSAVPDFTEIVLPLDAVGFVFLGSASLWQLMNCEAIVQFISKRLVGGVFKSETEAQAVVDALLENARNEWQMLTGNPLSACTAFLYSVAPKG